jgi:hypothetical protein
MARPKRALLHGALALLCASAWCAAVVSGAACTTRNMVEGVATDGTDATAAWTSADGKTKITGCNNTLDGNVATADGQIVEVVGSDNVVRAPARTLHTAGCARIVWPPHPSTRTRINILRLLCVGAC